MDNKEKEEYPGEFKDNLIKIAILIPALVFAGLYFFMINDLFFWIFLALMFIENISLFRKKRNNF